MHCASATAVQVLPLMEGNEREVNKKLSSLQARLENMLSKTCFNKAAEILRKHSDLDSG